VICICGGKVVHTARYARTGGAKYAFPSNDVAAVGHVPAALDCSVWRLSGYMAVNKVNCPGALRPAQVFDYKDVFTWFSLDRSLLASAVEANARVSKNGRAEN